MMTEAKLTLVLKNHLHLKNISEELKADLIDRLTLANPKWLENERMGRWNKGVAKVLRFYRKTAQGGLITPRGYIRQVLNLCHRDGLAFEIDDRRRTLTEVSFQFTGRLRTLQQTAVNDILAKEFGTLSAPTGSGKTVMALAVVAQRRQPALVVVHTKDLAFQWRDRIGAFLGVPEDEVGMIGGGKNKMGAAITVALVQSLYKRVDEVAGQIGFLIVDECHRTPSRTFTEAVKAFDCRYMLGLSATPWRRDQLSKLIFWHLGNLVHEMKTADLVDGGHVLQADIIVRETDFKPFYDPVRDYSRMLSELTSDDARNRLIAADVAKQVREGQGVCLVLTDRKHHCESLAALLRFGHQIEASVLTGDLTNQQRREVFENLQNGHIKVLIATGQLIGEGFDCKHLTTLFLATPIRFSGRVLQYLGRVLRPAPGKEKARVFDYVDVKVDVLVSAARARQKAYQQ